jgi:predicted small lipoprotein YifL
MKLAIISPLLLLVTSALAGCALSPPNVKPPSAYNALTPPLIKNTFYDPYAAYGSANATWVPPVVDRQGTIVKPADPSTQGHPYRQDYEHSEWATGASGGSQLRPPGTF